VSAVVVVVVVDEDELVELLDDYVFEGVWVCVFVEVTVVVWPGVGLFVPKPSVSA